MTLLASTWDEQAFLNCFMHCCVCQCLLFALNELALCELVMH